MNGGISVSEVNRTCIRILMLSLPMLIISRIPWKKSNPAPGWENMKAVKNNDVYYVDNYATSHCNHNIITGLEQMAEAIYPDIYR